jgi:hypothetical protein
MAYLDLVYTGDKELTDLFCKEAKEKFPGISCDVDRDEIHEYRVEVTGDIEQDTFWSWTLKSGFAGMCLALRLTANEKGMDWLIALKEGE